MASTTLNRARLNATRRRIAAYEAALDELISGRVTSYTVDGMSFSKLDVDKIENRLEKLYNTVEQLTGATRRCSTVNLGGF